MYFPYPITPVARREQVKCGLPDDSSKWVVWNYCGFFKNRQAESQPLVLVAFRELTGEATVSEDLLYKRIPVTKLGILRIGTIWEHQHCRAEFVFPTAQFRVSFDVDNWVCQSFQSHYPEPEPYPQSIYKLPFVRDKNYLLCLNLPGSARLAIPCIEVLCTMYGWSKELVRVLTTYPWSDEEGGTQNRLYGIPPKPLLDGQWVLSVRRNLRKEDATFLAHAKYNTFTTEAAKEIYSEIDSKMDPKDKVPAFIKVGPWFNRDALIKVEGIPFNKGRSFLGLRVVACSEPSGESMRARRDNTNLFKEEADENRGEAWEGRVRSLDSMREKPIVLTGSEEPDHGSASIEIVDRGFEYLGDRQVIDWVVEDKAQSSAGRSVSGQNTDTFSSGEHYGQDKSVGSASIHAEHVLESEGYLRDIWNAALRFKQLHPDLILSVESFTLNLGYSNSLEPRLVAFNPFDTDDKNSQPSPTGGARNWVYVDPKNKLIRGMLIIRIRVKGHSIHLLEIQRRPDRRGAGSAGKSANNGYRGLVVEMEDDAEFAPWLLKLLSTIRYHKGVFVKLLDEVPGKADLVKHTPSTSERFRYEAVFVNALKKMGTSIKA